MSVHVDCHSILLGNDFHITFVKSRKVRGEHELQAYIVILEFKSLK